MRVITCALLLVSLVAGDHHYSDEECDCSGPRVGLLRTRADNNDVEINRLFHLANELEKKVGVVEEGAPSIDELKARVDALTGNECDGDFMCADHSGCVNNLLVCDDNADCRDGSDESQETCDEIVPEGSSWGAYISHNTCFRKSANHLRIVITKAERSDIMPSTVSVEATTFLYTNSGELSVSSGEGSYSFGSRTLTLRATEGDILDLECHFTYDNEECTGVFSRGINEEPCGELKFHRE